MKGAACAVQTVKPHKRFGAARTKAFTTGTVLAAPCKGDTPARQRCRAVRHKPSKMLPRMHRGRYADFIKLRGCKANSGPIWGMNA